MYPWIGSREFNQTLLLIIVLSSTARNQYLPTSVVAASGTPNHAN